MAEFARRVEALASGRRGLWGVAVASCLESTVVPVPMETLLAPLMASRPERAWLVAAAATAGRIGGAAAFYLAALWLFDPVVRPALEALGLSEDFKSARRELEGHALFWGVFLVSLSPLPFQLATLGAGALKGALVVFLAAVALSTAIRYFGLALLARWVGPRVVRWAGGPERVLVGGAALCLGLFVAVTVASRALA